MKKLLSIALVVVLLAGIAVSGTMAYLQDTDSDVNVMTLGNVSIEQHEYERALNADGTYETKEIDGVASHVLKDFTQGKALLPATEVDANGQPYNYGAGNWDDTVVRMTQVGSYGSMQVFTSKNAQDKFVTVENTGKTDAYVRTLVAIENGTGDASLIGIGSRCVPAADADSSTAPWVSNYIGQIKVDDNTYGLYEYVYRGASDVNRHVNGILPAGDTTYPNLSQVYLQAKATNKDMEAIDGNKNGMLDILVLSQAVQAEGFENAQTALDTAFGKVADNAAEWFGGEEFETPILVATADELTEVLAEGGSVVLTQDIDLGKIDLTDAVANDVVIDANGHKITTTEPYGIEATPGKNITISNADIAMTKEGDYITYAAGFKIANGDYAGATITLKNCKISMANGDWAYAVNMPAGVKNLNLVIDNCTLEGAIAVQCWGDNNNIRITNSELICNYTTNALYTSDCVALQNDGASISENNTLVIDKCSFSYSGVDNFNSEIGSVSNLGINNTVTVTDCTYGEKVTVFES